MRIFKKYCPVYINTLNIFRPLKTWFYNLTNHWYSVSHKFPHIKVQFKKRDFKWLVENFYTWYWWDHPHIWNFEKKWIIILIDDVQYKSTYGIRQLESVPFILVRMFGWNFIMKFNAPKNEDNYQYWEQFK